MNVDPFTYLYYLSDYQIPRFCVYKLLLLEICAYAARREPAAFSLGSVLDSSLAILHPIVADGSSRCESLKNFLGVTYEQMTEKNATDFFKDLSIDLITDNGNFKYNITDNLGRVLNNAGQVVVLIHGFMESSDGWMVQAIAPEFLKKRRYKVLALDGRNVISIDYFKSSTYVRFMGIHLGDALSQSIINGQDPDKIMLIGHSLGAHIAGIAGTKVFETTGRKIGRITGLDPALPCFTTADLVGRLDPSDASYVDVIHTNGGILGMKEPVGHKDFYPNSGMTQPGCILTTCDHSRAWQLYAESVNAVRNFPALKCDNWTLYREGNCSKNEKTFMGLNSKIGTPGSYFLTTNSKPPYGLRSI